MSLSTVIVSPWISLLGQMKTIVIQLLSLGFFIALDRESTGDKLVFHINTLDCCESNILYVYDRKDKRYLSKLVLYQRYILEQLI